MYEFKLCRELDLMWNGDLKDWWLLRFFHSHPWDGDGVTVGEARLDHVISESERTYEAIVLRDQERRSRDWEVLIP